jgi:fatty-acid desaturase
VKRPPPPACAPSLLDYANVPDLKSQFFYRVLEVTFFPSLFIAKPLLSYYLGGMAAVTWGNAFPLVVGWHATFLVNSAAHIWGSRPYETGDLSTNNALVSLLAFGEGWHCASRALGGRGDCGLLPRPPQPVFPCSLATAFPI